MLLELTVALALLTTIGLVVFKGSLDLMAPRQWVLHQNIADAYISYEQALAERVSFDDITSSDSPWPAYPDSTTTEVEIGKMPGGGTLRGTVTRTRRPDSNNLTSAGGTGTTSTNPAEMETWQLQSHLTYRVGDKDYMKSRTVIRTQ